MGYESVDKLQKLLAEEVFSYTDDRKKAAGRALGTFLEIITYYLIKTWGLERFTAIEKPLPEFANAEITHNVEFTLHGSRKVGEFRYDRSQFPISSKTVLRSLKTGDGSDGRAKSSTVINRNGVIRNACALCSFPESFLNAYVDSSKEQCSVYRLLSHPFAMFECKRVGVEEGARKGPQTIEKAKQGSYVARTVSALQRIRKADGSLAGFFQKSENDYVISEYYGLLSSIIDSGDVELLRNFILTVGVVSNHGNWFTSETPNKELKVLAQSYDWLLFLTDGGISEFITELLVAPDPKYEAVKAAFRSSYSPLKKGNVFTKVKMDCESDKALCSYFSANQRRIEGWFNVISPNGMTLSDMKRDLSKLAAKDWGAVYGAF